MEAPFMQEPGLSSGQAREDAKLSISSSSEGQQDAKALPLHVQYANESYWDTRYKLQPQGFDWFYGWSALRKFIQKTLPQRPVLQIGCGNSNLQEGMARAGYNVINVDISQVVVDQMREQHAGIPGLEYVRADCRELPYPECSFATVLDKGTVDALLCSGDGMVNVHKMLQEASRVLQPGGMFVLITLGDPSKRLAMLCRPEFGWSVSLCLLPRALPEEMVEAPGRPIPINDTKRPVRHLGPFPVDPNTYEIGNLPAGLQLSHYFYAYCCRKTPLTLRDDKQPGSMPAGWCTSTKQALEKLAEDLGVPMDLLKRGRRTRHMPMSEFLAHGVENSGGSGGSRSFANGGMCMSRNASGTFGQSVHATSRTDTQGGEAVTPRRHTQSRRTTSEDASSGAVADGGHRRPHTFSASPSARTLGGQGMTASLPHPHHSTEGCPSSSVMEQGASLGSCSKDEQPGAHTGVSTGISDPGAAAACGGCGDGGWGELPSGSQQYSPSLHSDVLDPPLLFSPQPVRARLESTALQSLVQVGCSSSPSRQEPLDSPTDSTSWCPSPDPTYIPPSATLPHEDACLAADAVAVAVAALVTPGRAPVVHGPAPTAGHGTGLQQGQEVQVPGRAATGSVVRPVPLRHEGGPLSTGSAGLRQTAGRKSLDDVLGSQAMGDCTQALVQQCHMGPGRTGQPTTKIQLISPLASNCHDLMAGPSGHLNASVCGGMEGVVAATDASGAVHTLG